jgi:hypothetical protein
MISNISPLGEMLLILGEYTSLISLISVQICLTDEWRSGILARNVHPTRC